MELPKDDVNLPNRPNRDGQVKLDTRYMVDGRLSLVATIEGMTR